MGVWVRIGVWVSMATGLRYTFSTHKSRKRQYNHKSYIIPADLMSEWWCTCKERTSLTFPWPLPYPCYNSQPFHGPHYDSQWWWNIQCICLVDEPTTQPIFVSWDRDRPSYPEQEDQTWTRPHTEEQKGSSLTDSRPWDCCWYNNLPGCTP